MGRASSLQRYLTPTDIDAHTTALRRDGQMAFAVQRDAIADLVEILQPASIACLGAGALSDIPYAQMVQAGAEIHLVEWVPGLTAKAIDQASIRVDGGSPSCLYCSPHTGDPGDYCMSYRGMHSATRQVCDAFQSAAPQCGAFRKGRLPVLYEEDVTGGFSQQFAHRTDRALPRAESWKTAVTAGMEIAQQCARIHAHLSLPDASMDLVTSSMVVSQFEHEPYGYFSTRAAATLGTPSTRDESKLQPLVRQLVSRLVRHQLAGHLEEIARILRPEGRCFLALELFQRSSDRASWLLGEYMGEALSMTGRRFDFDFDLLAHDNRHHVHRTRAGDSQVYTFVLRHKGQARVATHSPAP